MCLWNERNWNRHQLKQWTWSKYNWETGPNISFFVFIYVYITAVYIFIKVNELYNAVLFAFSTIGLHLIIVGPYATTKAMYTPKPSDIMPEHLCMGEISCIFSLRFLCCINPVPIMVLNLKKRKNKSNENKQPCNLEADVHYHCYLDQNVSACSQFTKFTQIWFEYFNQQLRCCRPVWFTLPIQLKLITCKDSPVVNKFNWYR